MKRKILALSFTVLLLIAATFALSSCRKALAVADKAVGNYLYEASPSGGITITKYMGNMTKIEIPSEINGYTVDSIEPDAFSEIPGIKSVVLPKTIDYIPTNLFTDCRVLQNVTFYAENVILADRAFADCISLTKVTAKGGIAQIGEFAFSNCIRLETVKAKNGIDEIYSYAFNGCKALKNITLSTDLSYVNTNAFIDCEFLALGEYENCLYLASEKNPYAYLLGPISTSITSASIHPDTEFIAKRAFAFCNDLSSLTINCKKISDPYFGLSTISNLSNFTLVLGSNLPEIPYRLINSENIASGLYGLTFEDGINITNMEKVEFSKLNALVTLTIPKGITTISEYTFSGLTNLKYVYLPAGLTTIKTGAFKNCTNLRTVDIQDGLTAIEISAFAGCINLSSINLPLSLTQIGAYAFSNCGWLYSVGISKNVTFIGEHAFENCSKLTIYTEWDNRPQTWDSQWNSSSCPVNWTYN